MGAGRKMQALAVKAPHNEKAPDDAGALTSELAFGSVVFSSVLCSSVLRDDRTGPVEAVDQRGGDRLVPAVGTDAVAGRKVNAVNQLVLRLGVVEGRTILGLHEPAGRG